MSKEFAQQKDTKKPNERSTKKMEPLISENQLPNSLVMRIMQDQSAEDEANNLSRNLRSATPDAVRSEMGSRLGADFSSVRFHNDPSSRRQSEAMGANAYTQGNDVYFGKRGFTPSVAAHELVHTVQQGAVKGNVSQSMPLGAVQMDPKDDNNIINTNSSLYDREEAEDLKNEPKGMEIKEIEKKLMKYFATDEGVQLYGDFESRLQSLVTSKISRKNLRYDAAAYVRFLVRACYRDYALKDILQEVVNNPVQTKNDRKERAHEYKSLIKTVSSRLTPADAESLAIETGIFTGVPNFSYTKNRKNTRAYNVEAGDNGLVDFNPNQIPELKKVQDAIDNAPNIESAYSIFAAYTGNNSGSFIDNYKNIKVDMKIFRSKLKHMARVVTDYPELKGQIGDMTVLDPNDNALMSTIGTRGGQRQAQFFYDKQSDREGIWGDLERDISEEQNKKDNFHSSPQEYHGTHEMGHVLSSLLIEESGIREGLYERTTLNERLKKLYNKAPLPDNYKAPNGRLTNKIREEEAGLPENAILESALTNNKARIMRHYGTDNFTLYKRTQELNDQIYMKGLIATQRLGKNMTSGYGSRNVSEMFAEAVADVYSHGKSARPMSRELVKEYENRQKKNVRDKFNHNKKSWWKRLLGW